MKSVYGYIIPPFKVNDFVPVVYTEQDDYYIAEIQDHYIEGFICIEKESYNIKAFSEIEKSAFDIKTKVDRNSPALYVFLTETGHTDINWPHTLYDFHIRSLFNSRYNIYTKLSIAIVLDLVGLRFKIIETLNERLKLTEASYSYPFVGETDFESYSSVHQQAFQEKLKALHLLKKTYNTISWEDLIYLWEDNLYVGKFKISSENFKRDFPGAKSILLDYCSTKTYSKQVSIMEANRLSYQEWLPDIKETPSTESLEIIQDYYQEKRSTDQMTDYHQKLSIAQLRFYTSKFKAISDLCDAD